MKFELYKEMVYPRTIILILTIVFSYLCLFSSVEIIKDFLIKIITLEDKNVTMRMPKDRFCSPHYAFLAAITITVAPITILSRIPSFSIFCCKWMFIVQPTVFILSMLSLFIPFTYTMAKGSG
ncbi:hypothetical protein MXB_2373 [Myxobolus squamalis]|nr:hypothetical protein MXB_2373 [Myxobolus squamalis]